jgi:2,3-bisphosphoglycerate-dependent phosphoglycerate mutase
MALIGLVITAFLTFSATQCFGLLGPSKFPSSEQKVHKLVVSESGYSQTDGYSRIVDEQSFAPWQGIFSRADPGRAHLKEVDRMMGMNARFFRRASKPGTLILMRNGESAANTTFAGWSDPDISEKGLREVQHAARLLRESGYEPDVVFTSRLKRAVHSSWETLREMNMLYLPVIKSWRLNGRHYGALTGLSKAEVAQTFGENLVQKWRTDVNAIPPPMTRDDPFWTANERKFVDVDEIPEAESLVDCMKRIEPLWREKIMPELRAGHDVLVVSHTTNLRGLIKYIQHIDDDHVDIQIPPGSPLVYNFDRNLEAVRPDNTGKKELWAHFLEKPGLLERALEEEVYRSKHIPGYKPKATRSGGVMNSLEESLSKLYEERSLWADDDKATDESEFFNSDFEAHLNQLSRIKNVKHEVIANHPCLAPLPEGVKIPDDLSLPSRKGATIVMVRHGKTGHNNLGIFTGWQDPPLALQGLEEGRRAGKLLKKYGFDFDVVYTSWLSRAIETAWLILDELDSTWLPIVKSWRLNERAYGALSGKSKKMIAREYGEEKFNRWRRGYSVRPPSLHSFSPDYPGNDQRYVKFLTDVRYSISESLIRSIGYKKPTLCRKFPKTESLKDCMVSTILRFSWKKGSD